jgi:hypothetical protein
MSDNTTKKGGLITLDELNDFEYIRPEFVAPTFRPKITLEYGAFMGNSACVRLFPESEHIVILSDKHAKRLAIWSCRLHAVGATHWSRFKNGKLMPKRVSAKHMCAKIFRMMKWDINTRYKAMAVYQEFPDKKLAVFNLEDAEGYTPEQRKGSKRKQLFPIDWENSFGLPYAEYETAHEIDLQSLHIVTNYENDKPPVVARIPTPGEIITREYYVPDEIVEQGKIDEGKNNE